MKRIVSSTAITILFVSCTDRETESPPAEESEAHSTEAGVSGAAKDDRREDASSKELALIPSSYRGLWATSPADCTARNFNRFTVAADRVSFFEDGGIASDIRANGNALAVTYPFENPNGTIESRVVYFAQETRDRIRVRRAENDSLTYQRC